MDLVTQTIFVFSFLLIRLLEQMDADVEDRWIAVIAILMVIVWILGVHFQWF